MTLSAGYFIVFVVCYFLHGVGKTLIMRKAIFFFFLGNQKNAPAQLEHVIFHCVFVF